MDGGTVPGIVTLTKVRHSGKKYCGWFERKEEELGRETYYLPDVVTSWLGSKVTLVLVLAKSGGCGNLEFLVGLQAVIPRCKVIIFLNLFENIFWTLICYDDGWLYWWW